MADNIFIKGAEFVILKLEEEFTIQKNISSDGKKVIVLTAEYIEMLKEEIKSGR